MMHEYLQYAVWNGMACFCRCLWSETIQAWYMQSFDDLMGHGLVCIRPEKPDMAELTEYELHIREDNHFALCVESGKIFLTMPGGELIRTEAIHCLLTDIFQHEHKKRGLFSLHSGAYCLRGKTILLVGETGAGKTMLLLRGHERIPDFNILANDYVVVRPGKTLELMYGDADSNISVRRDIVDVSEKGSVLSSFAGSENRRYYAWQGSVLFEPKTIDLILFPELTDVHDGLSIAPMSLDEAFYRLYYSTMMLDSGLQLMLFNSEGELMCPVPNLVNEALVITTCKGIEEMVSSVPIVRVIGGLESILDYFEEQSLK